jgi:ABC-2 type transport system permease protein
VTADSGARILDRGYRRYEGSRSGVAGAVRSVAWHSTRSILGLGRKARHKIFPVIVVALAFIPSIAFLGLTVLIGDLLEDEIRPEYWELFGFSFFAIMLFSTLVAPEAIVRDRRDGMLSLYLSTPLTRPTYVGAKVLAVMGTMSIIILGPPILALLGYTFQSQGPDDVVEWFEVLAKLLASGLIIAAVLTAVSLGASSITDRRAFASVSVIMVLLGSSIVSNVLVETAGMSSNLLVFDPLNVPLEVSARLFDDHQEEFRDVDTGLVLVGNLGWITAGSSVVWWKYRRLGAV